MESATSRWTNLSTRTVHHRVPVHENEPILLTALGDSLPGGQSREREGRPERPQLRGRAVLRVLCRAPHRVSPFRSTRVHGAFFAPRRRSPRGAILWGLLSSNGSVPFASNYSGSAWGAACKRVFVGDSWTRKPIRTVHRTKNSSYFEGLRGLRAGRFSMFVLSTREWGGIRNWRRQSIGRSLPRDDLRFPQVALASTCDAK